MNLYNMSSFIINYMKKSAKINIDKQVQYLNSKDIKFKKISSIVGSIEFYKNELNFESLVKIIINQQLSNIVANKIFLRLKNLINSNNQLEPGFIRDIDIEILRNCGISNQKSKYIINLSNLLLENPDLLNEWGKLDYENASIEIQKIKGFGKWSSDIIQLSYLGNLDVLPINDATITKAILKIYNFKLNINTEKKLDWARPYRSILSRYLWRWIDLGNGK